MDKEELTKINKQEIRVGIVGNVDVGKTSLISVLTNNLLDNGRGSARALVMKHPHEQTSGRTSSITLNFMRTYFNSIEELNDKENKQFYDYDRKETTIKHKTNENKNKDVNSGLGKANHIETQHACNGTGSTHHWNLRTGIHKHLT